MRKYKVPPLGRENIRMFVHQVKDKLGVSDLMEFPIVQILEVLANNSFLELEIVDKNSMSEEALTYPKRRLIQIREDVYEKAVIGHNRFRFTIAHELGHLLLHINVEPSYARTDEEIKPYEDSEWQANCFAGELLVDSRLCKSLTPIEISARCKVSLSAAEVQYKTINK